ncbi:MAG: helix-turn-helix domain-containing protein [Verrucomicrobiota bacterium]
MSSVGQQLRAAREAQKLTLNQVAEATKIRTDYLQALEEAEYASFTAPVYIRGFVRTYSTMLKLEVPALMDQLGVELSQTTRFRDPPSLSPRKRGLLDDLMLFMSRIHWTIVLPVIAVILLGVVATLSYQAYRRHKTEDPLANLGPGLYQPSTDVRDLRLTVPTNTAPAHPRR